MAIANPDFCLPEGDRMLSAEEPYLIERNLTSNDPNCGAPGVTHSMVDPNNQYKFHNDSALIVLATDGVNRNCEASDECEIGEIIMNFRGDQKFKINKEQLFSSTWFHEFYSVIMRLYGIQMDSNGATNEDFVSEVERQYLIWRYDIEPIE